MFGSSIAIEVDPSVDITSMHDAATINEMELTEVKLEDLSPRRIPRKSKRAQYKDDSRVVAVVEF